MDTDIAIKWDEKWLIGDAQIDLQHGEPVKLVNQVVFNCEKKGI